MHILKRCLIGLLAASLLASCATGYQPSNGSTGYSDTQLQQDMFKVSYAGNAGTNHGMAKDMVLMRAAHLAMDHGFNYFVIVDSKPARTQAQRKAIVSRKEMREDIATGADSRFALQGFDLYDGKPEQTDIVKCYTTKPDTAEQVYEAKDTFNYYIRRYQLSVSPK